MVRLNAFVENKPLSPVAFTVKLAVPRAVGIPLITPALLTEPQHPVIEEEIDAEDLAILTEPAGAESAAPAASADEETAPEAAPEPPADKG